MRYFVIGDDGQKYGPADVATLNGWIAEGRLLAVQQLEEEESGNRLAASAVAGLNFPIQSTQQFAPGQPYQQHYVRPDANFGDDGSKELKNAWIFGWLSLPCCGIVGIVLAILGIQSANKAIAKGHPNAQGAKVLCIVSLVLTGIVLVSYAGIVLYSISQK